MYTKDLVKSGCATLPNSVCEVVSTISTRMTSLAEIASVKMAALPYTGLAVG